MPTVLVVDDSEVDRRLVGGLLEKQGGCRVAYAPDGKAALQQFEAGVPDLVLTDLQMPEMDDLALVAAMKGDYPLTPVILMTARGSEAIASERNATHDLAVARHARARQAVGLQLLMQLA